jgi:hypothetical protein
MLRLVERDTADSLSLLSHDDMRDMHRYIVEERHIAAMELLLRYAIDEAAGLGLPQCAQQLQAALASIRQPAQ